MLAPARSPAERSVICNHSRMPPAFPLLHGFVPDSAGSAEPCPLLPGSGMGMGRCIIRQAVRQKENQYGSTEGF